MVRYERRSFPGGVETAAWRPEPDETLAALEALLKLVPYPTPDRRTNTCMPRRAHRLGACLLGVGVLLLWGSPTRADKTQGWLNNSLKVSFGSHWNAKLTQELRGREADHDGTMLRNWSLGTFRKLPAGVYVGASFKREEEVTSQGERTENRYVLEAGWSTAISPILHFDIRARYEDRNFEEEFATDDERGRLRFRLRTRDHLGPLRLRPFVSTELFIGTLGGERIDRNRFIVGTAAGVHDHVELFLGYLRQDTDGRPALHAVSTGVDLSF